MALAKQFNCEQILRPIIEFQPEAKSPPLAPKHLVAPIPGRPPARRTAGDNAGTQGNARGTRRSVRDDISSDVEDASVRGSEDVTRSSTPSHVSSTSPTPSPIHETPDHSMYDSDAADERNYPRTPRRRRRAEQGGSGSEDETMNATNGLNYCDEILEYFISDSNQIPQVLIEPPADFDPNMAIDDDAHTALHWATAMGRIRVVKLLLTAGADIFKVNKSGQTALMRSVMFANNYDIRKFPELYELLHRSTLNIDHFNRTVFHHIVDIAMSKGKTHAARYYMETILQRLAEYPKELADIINFQDEDGETALTMAARCRSKRLVKLLIDHGADPKIVNRDGKSTEDYILEDERFRSSPVLPSRSTNMPLRTLSAAYPSFSSSSQYPGTSGSDKPPLHHSVTAQVASTRCVNDMASMLESLASSFDQELRDKERDMTQAHSLLGSIQSEILESQRSVVVLKLQSQGLDEMKAKLGSLEHSLKVKMGQRYHLGWEKWLKDEEERERFVRERPQGRELAFVPGSMENSTPHSMDVLPGSEPPNMASLEKGKGRLQISETEDISDLHALYSDLPSDDTSIRMACQSLRESLEQSRTRRRGLVDDLVRLQAEAGTSGRMNQYRRLIGAGCGGLPPREVDGVLSMLLEVMFSGVDQYEHMLMEHCSRHLNQKNRVPQRRLGAANPLELAQCLLVDSPVTLGRCRFFLFD